MRIKKLTMRVEHHEPAQLLPSAHPPEFDRRCCFPAGRFPAVLQGGSAWYVTSIILRLGVSLLTF